MARRSKVDAERTRERILASALDLFALKGYEHTTFTDIAARLKLTKGAVYWHFESKEALLVALVRQALERFRRQIEAAMPTGELTFPAVAEMMVACAETMVADARAAAFFRLMKCQLRWTDDSMRDVRQKLMTDVVFGPEQTFRAAVEQDVASGRIRPGVDAEEIAAVCISLWDGLVQARLDGFLKCDLAVTLRHAYTAIWNDLLRAAERLRSPRASKTRREGNG